MRGAGAGESGVGAACRELSGDVSIFFGLKFGGYVKGGEGRLSRLLLTVTEKYVISVCH